MRLFFSHMAVLFISGALFLAEGAVRPAFAADERPGQALGEVSIQPACFNIVNQAPYTVFGSVNTNFFIRPDGVKTRHKSNFRIEPESYAQFCTSGPFYEGRQVELVLRSLVPLFTCKTGIGGDIVIRGEKNPEGGAKTWAECLL